MAKKAKKKLDIDWIVDDVFRRLDDDYILFLADDNLEPSLLHFTLGLTIRNSYGLWEFGDADNLSSIIIDKLIIKCRKFLLE